MVNTDKRENTIKKLYFNLTEGYKFTKVWAFLITITLGVSLFNVSISLFKIDKMSLFSREYNSRLTTKTINDDGSVITCAEGAARIANAWKYIRGKGVHEIFEKHEMEKIMHDLERLI